MPTPRQTTLLAAMTGPLVLIALALLAGADVISVTAAIVLGAITAVLGVQILVIATVRRIDGKAQRIDNRVKRCEAETVQLKAATERLERRLGEITELIREHERRRDEDLQAILVSLGEDRLAAVPQRREVEKMIQELLPRLVGAQAGTGRAKPERTA
ncbi:hypothetical protein GCM10010517_25280 [Streptosporangium fragile]|uniref:Uncharacterized protein n=1 Tax=Streptosporangium fragile TaxID=46186 RepID=A0ABN3VVU8_9ACTN